MFFFRRSGKCLFNSLAYNCDFQDAIGKSVDLIKHLKYLLLKEQQMKPLTGGQALLEKGKDLAKGRTRKLEQSTKLQLFILYLFF
jgi:hypothetical protein